MEMIADILLLSGALGASFYCYTLGRKLNRFNSLEKGVGGAVAVLSAQVDDLEKTLESAQQTALKSAETLTELSGRAEDIARKLELQMAALHDVSETDTGYAKQKPQLAKKIEPMFVRRPENGVQQ